MPILHSFLFLSIARKWNGEMRYIPNIRIKKLVKPVKQEALETTDKNEVSAKTPETSEVQQSKKLEETDTSNNVDGDKTVTLSEVESNDIGDMLTD